jgi:hypothetical protein
MAQAGTAAGRHAAPRQAVVGTAPRTMAPPRDVAGCDVALWCSVARPKRFQLLPPDRLMLEPNGLNGDCKMSGFGLYPT